jgi:hypothetical protein
MYFQEEISRKTLKKISFLLASLKVNDENSRNSNLDPLVRGRDSRIRIRIHTKMSWIPNTAPRNEIIDSYVYP